MMNPSVLEKEYVDKGMTDLQISLSHGIDRIYVSKLRKEYSIPTRETTGTRGEKIVVKELTRRGLTVENMNEISMTSSHDLTINGFLKVDVKSAVLSKDNFFRFCLTDSKKRKKIESDVRAILPNGRTKKNYSKTCDYIILVCIENNDNNHLFYIPSSAIPTNQQSISIPLSLAGKYSAYKDVRDFLMNF